MEQGEGIEELIMRCAPVVANENYMKKMSRKKTRKNRGKNKKKDEEKDDDYDYINIDDNEFNETPDPGEDEKIKDVNKAKIKKDNEGKIIKEEKNPHEIKEKQEKEKVIRCDDKSEKRKNDSDRNLKSKEETKNEIIRKVKKSIKTKNETIECTKEWKSDGEDTNKTKEKESKKDNCSRRLKRSHTIDANNKAEYIGTRRKTDDINGKKNKCDDGTNKKKRVIDGGEKKRIREKSKNIEKSRDNDDAINDKRKTKQIDYTEIKQPTSDKEKKINKMEINHNEKQLKVQDKTHRRKPKQQKNTEIVKNNVDCNGFKSSIEINNSPIHIKKNTVEVERQNKTEVNRRRQHSENKIKKTIFVDILKNKETKDEFLENNKKFEKEKNNNITTLQKIEMTKEYSKAKKNPSNCEMGNLRRQKQNTTKSTRNNAPRVEFNEKNIEMKTKKKTRNIPAPIKEPSASTPNMRQPSSIKSKISVNIKL